VLLAPTGSVVVCRGGRYDKYYMLYSILLELRLAMISYVRVTLRCLYVKMLDVVLAQVMSYGMLIPLRRRSPRSALSIHEIRQLGIPDHLSASLPPFRNPPLSPPETVLPL